MDIVFVQGLKVDTVIGIYDWERKIRQDIILDIEMSSDIAKAAILVSILTNFTIFSVIAISASCLDNLIFPPAKLSGLIL